MPANLVDSHLEAGERAHALLGIHFGDFNFVELRYSLLNIVDGNLLGGSIE